MLSNFPNWRSGVTFPVVPISCFTGEHYCCPGRLLNARFLAKKWDPGEGILLMLHVSMLQVLGNGFTTWKSFLWLAFPGSADVHLDSGIQCDGSWTQVRNLSSRGPKALHLQQPGKAWVSTCRRFVHWSFPVFNGKIIYSWVPFTHFSVIYQVSFIAFLVDSGAGPPLKVSCEAAAVFLLPWGCNGEKRLLCCSSHPKPASQPSDFGNFPACLGKQSNSAVQMTSKPTFSTY